MSASLVGSEMCIRDRCGVLALAASAAALDGEPCLALVPAGPVRRMPRPVSYTHLTLPTICSV
eukprot:6498190-Alexandrium_andersonii.AAC.1